MYKTQSTLLLGTKTIILNKNQHRLALLHFSKVSNLNKVEEIGPQSGVKDW